MLEEPFLEADRSTAESGVKRCVRAGGKSRLRLRSKTFAQAQDFRALFILLDARQMLWGSQKCYTAQELKILINRVRTPHPAVHLPLVVIPETGGLRQRVQELVDAERRVVLGSAETPS